ncbi:MAG: hypothetical protein GY792_35020 [Gammaproteobacteria bacterium]|nr:hypothetical protein [Gammaproteobacteria bacterium]
MNTSVAANKFETTQFRIAALFSTAFIGLTVLLCTGLMLMADQPAQASPAEQMPPQINETRTTEHTMSASEVLGQDLPTLILFYPVEVCQRRYCLTPELVEARLGAIDLQTVNLMSVPVYAVSMEASQVEPELPLLGWDVYAVEPYRNWLPAFSQTVYGWGLEAPVVVLVDSDGTVLYRGEEYFAPEELEPYVERLALSAATTNANSVGE